MVNSNIDVSNLVAAIFITLLTGTLFIIFARKRQQTSVHALDWLMAVFGTTALLGIFQILKVFFSDEIPIFGGPNIPRSTDITVILNLVILLILYFMVESFLSDRPNVWRLIGVTILSTSFLLVGVIYSATGLVIHSSYSISGKFFLF